MKNLSILNQEIRIVDGLFCLNDLHKASGNQKKHAPALFLRLDGTKDLITEIESEKSSYTHLYSLAKLVKNGVGTFVCKELVYAYAMWISAKFSLVVIRAFDAMVNGKQTEQPKLDQLSTGDDRVGLRQAISKLVSTKGLLYPDAYNMVNQRFNKGHIDQFKLSELPEAIQYVHELTISNALEGELMPREELPRKDQSNGLALMMHGTKVKNVQDEKISKAKELMGEAMHLIEQAEKCSGAIWDGLYESRMYMNFSKDERQEAHQKSDDIFESWKARRKF